LKTCKIIAIASYKALKISARLLELKMTKGQLYDLISNPKFKSQ